MNREWQLLVPAAALVMCGFVASVGCSGTSPTRPNSFPQFRNLDAVPTWSPDGRSIAFLHESRDSSDAERIAIVDTSGSSTTPLISISPTMAPQLAWSPDGTRIAYWDGGIMTVGIATREARLWTGPYAAYPSWSPDGRFLIYLVTVRGPSAPDSTGGLHIIDTQVGDQRALIRNGSQATFGSYPVWSPNGRTIAFMSNEVSTSGNIVAVDLAGTNYRQITHLNGWCADLQWSADGQRIYFHFTPSPAPFDDPATTQSWVVNSDGSGQRRLSVDLGDLRVHFWFHFAVGRGDRVAYTGLDPTGAGGVIWTMNIDGSDRRQVTSP